MNSSVPLSDFEIQCDGGAGDGDRKNAVSLIRRPQALIALSFLVIFHHSLCGMCAELGWHEIFSPFLSFLVPHSKQISYALVLLL